MIGIFDSGLGGVSIWEKIITLLPNENSIYVADQGYLPYGDKSEDYIINRSRKISKFLINSGARTIVVACNTATGVAIETLRKEFTNTEFVGVEPALKPAGKLGRGARVLVLATKATLNSKRFMGALDTYGIDLVVISRSVPEWVEQVEVGRVNDSPWMNEALTMEIKNADVLVLACTHYIFFADYLRVQYPNKVIIEPSGAVANRTRVVHKFKNGRGKTLFVTTGNKKTVNPIINNLLKRQIQVEFKEL